MKKLFWIRLLSWMCLIGLLLTGCTKEHGEAETACHGDSSNISEKQEQEILPTQLSVANGLSLDLADIEAQGISCNVVTDLLKYMNVQSVYLCFSMTDLLDANGAIREDVVETYTLWMTAMKQSGVKHIVASVSGGLWEKSYQVVDTYAFPYPDGDADSLWSSYLAYYEKCFSTIATAFPQVDLWQTGVDYNLNEYVHPVAYAERNTTFVAKEKAAVCVDLSRAAKQALVQCGSQALVVLPSVAVSEDYSSAAEFYEGIYSYLESGRSPYGKMAPQDAFDVAAWKPFVNWYEFDSVEFMAGNRQIRDVMEKNGDASTPVLLTAFGFSDYGSLTYDSIQGEWLTQLMEAVGKMSYVGAAFPARMIEMRKGSADEKIYSGMFRVFGSESLGAKEKAKALCLAYGGNPDHLDTYKGDNVVYTDQTYRADAMNGIAFPVKGADERELNIGKIMDLLKTMNVECMRNWMNIRTLLVSPTQINRTEVEKQKQWIAMLNNRGISKIVGMSQGWFWPDGSVNDELAAPYRDTSDGSLYMQFLETYKQSWKTLAKAFPEIQYWEVGNETNHDPFLHPTTYTTRKTTFSTEEKAQITVDMLYYAAMGIREANPDAVVIFPGIAAVKGFDSIRGFLNSAYTYIESGNALGGTDPDAYFDAVAWHVYYFSTTFTPENWLNGNNAIYQVMKDHGDGEKKYFSPNLVSRMEEIMKRISSRLNISSRFMP